MAGAGGGAAPGARVDGLNRTMKRLAAVVAALALGGCATTAQQAPPFDGQRALEHTRQLVALGPRPAGSPGLARARAYIKEQLTRLGLTVQEQAFEADTPLGRIAMVNLSTVIGAVGSGRRLIIAGHYDTKLFTDVTFVGANDGGSSTGFLIEIARILKQAPAGLPVEVLFLDGEEAIRRDWLDPDNRYGSRYYVQAARKNRTLAEIGALVLVDMIGDRDLRIKRETQSTGWLTDTIWAAAARLGRKEFSEDSTPIEDDHIPFIEAGVAAVDLIDFEYPAWHTPADTLDKLSAASFQAVGDVLLSALPAIEKRIRQDAAR